MTTGPRRRSPSGWLLPLLLGLTGLTGLAAVASPPAVGDAPFCTPPPASGLVVNQWQGPAAGGAWNDDANWSAGSPDAGSQGQLCAST